MIRTLGNKALHYPFVFDVIRVALGIFLFLKGIEFIKDGVAMEEIVKNSRVPGFGFILVHQVAFAYLVGGILISIGLITRLASFFILLIYFGMLINGNTEYGLYSVYYDKVMAVIMTIVLVFYVIYGSGYYSVSHYMGRHKT